MAEPILVVDPGAYATSAALILDGTVTLLREPVTGANSWRSDRSLGLSGLLARIREHAQRLCDEPLVRLTVTIPAGYPVPDPRRDAFIESGEAAGFLDVELLGDASAAVLCAQAASVVGEHALVLICDLGKSWTTTLAQVRGDTVVPLGQDTSFAGRDLDDLLLDDLHVQGVWTQQPSGRGEVSRRAETPGRDEAIEFLHQLKHSLGPAPQISGRLHPNGQVYTLHREWLDRLAEPGLRWIVASCRSLFARAAAGMPATPGGPTPAGGSALAAGATLADVSAVLLVGGGARLPTAEAIIAGGLNRPVRRPSEPELAVLRGAVEWGLGAPRRSVLADHPKWRVEPLRWAIPGGRGQVVAWNVAEGRPFTGGSVLAQVRTPDQRIFDLTAADDGVLLAQPAPVGSTIGPTLLIRAKRPASPLAGDPPGKRQELSASGEWFLTPDRQLLVECVPSAAQVRLRSIPDGHVVSSFEPDWDSARPHQGRVFVSPTGRLSLVAWDPTGTFSIFDLLSGHRVVTFRDGNPPQQVTVNESQWRLTVAGLDSGSAGRYQRSVASVWDLATGRRLEKLADNRLPPGYVDRSAYDSFGTRAVSPDGRMCAVAIRSTTGSAALALQDSTTDAELFRAEHTDSRQVRTAFSADGQYLLANWDCDQRSEVDVWEL